MKADLRQRVGQAVALLSEAGFLRALTTWPEFSITSFLMVSRLAKLGIQPRTIIDAGANTGQFAVAAAKCFPGSVVHSYEPVPECYLKLQKAATGVSNIRTSPLALGDQAGDLEMIVNSHTHSSSVLALTEHHKTAFPSALEMRKIRVAAGTLDGEYGSRDIARPALLKLDVQGYEDRVLKGAQRMLPRIDYIVVEMSFRPLYQGERTFCEMLGPLKDFGFEFLEPVGFLRDPKSARYLQMDGLFGRRDCALHG